MKTIIEMAREADALPYLASSGPRHLECLTRFATLVKAAHTAELLEGVEMPEPVAWQWMGTGHFRKNLPKDAEKYCWRPLYTTPQPAPSTSQPLPLERLHQLANRCTPNTETGSLNYVNFARMVEADHKIGAKP